jgi:tetratricopeptide (TPR) repeat protein
VTDSSHEIAEQLFKLSRKLRVSFALSLLTIAGFLGLLGYLSLQVDSLASKAGALQQDIARNKTEIADLTRDLDRKKRGVEILNVAVRYFFDQNFEAAAATLQTFIQNDPSGSSSSVLVTLGYTEMRIGLTLRKKAQANPSNGSVDLSAASQAFKRAEQYLEKAAALDPSAFLPAYNLVLAKYWGGDKDAALDYLDGALKSKARFANSVCEDFQFRQFMLDSKIRDRFSKMVRETLKDPSQPCPVLKPVHP